MSSPDAPNDALNGAAQRFIATRFLTISILIHAIFVLMVGGTVLYRVTAEAPDFEAGGDGFLVEASTQPELPPLPSLEQPMDQQFTPQAPALQAPLTALVTATQLAPTWTLKVVPNAPIRGISDSMRGVLQSTGNRAGQAGGFGSTGMGRAGGTRAGMIFGRKIMATKLGVILDVSGSAHPYLAGAVDEIQKGFADAVLILYPGCGLVQYEGKSHHDIRLFSSIPRREFRSDAEYFTTASFLFSALKISEFEQMTKRTSVKDTLFVSWYDERNGTSSKLIGRTQVAFEDLFTRGVDTIFWFSDFADATDPRVIDDLAVKMKARRITLHLHNFGGGRIDEEVIALAEKTGGTVTTKPNN